MKTIAAIFLGIAICTVPAGALCQGAKNLLDVQVPWTPEPVTINGKSMLYYEVHVINLSPDSIQLKEMKVIDTAVIFSADSMDLRKRFSGTMPARRQDILPPGATGIIYLEYVLPPDRLNAELIHRIDFDMLQKGGSIFRSVQSGEINLSGKTPIVLGSPLRVGNWAAVYDPSWARGHRRVVFTVGEKKYIPGRFAIDFIKLDDHGRYAKDDEDRIENWYGYGVDVYAVADGTIAAAADHFKESSTISKHPKYPSEKATGNYISLDVGNGHYVFYEHLKPGSIKVKAGQKVKKGDVIASLGFTGQSTGPHLHFHVANMNSPLGAEGIPFVFESYQVIGTYDDFSKFGKSSWIPAKPSLKVIKERPEPNSVIKF